MASLTRSYAQNYAPSAPSLPENYPQEPEPEPEPEPFSPPPPSSSSSQPPPPPPSTSSSQYPDRQSYPPPPSYYGYYGYPPIGGHFPPGTHPEIIGSFQMVDKDFSGFIDENELQEALSFGYLRFSIRTVRLLMFLFKNPNDQLKIGPREFADLWNCLGQWRGIFERFDRDRSGNIDSMELRDALYSLGYLVPPSVLQVLISKYDDGRGRRGELNFDSFVECGMIVKGLTEKFKEKDTRYIGSATLNYETFMKMVIPFIVP